MKWAWIIIGVALIVAITVICCFMIYADSYECSCFIWALYVLLIVCIISCRCSIMKKKQAGSMEKMEERLNRKNEEMQNSFETAIVKDILALQKELGEVKSNVEEYKELRNIVVP